MALLSNGQKLGKRRDWVVLSRDKELTFYGDEELAYALAIRYGAANLYFGVTVDMVIL